MWASGGSESRPWGAAGRTTWTAVVGEASETSARRGFCGVSLGRSSRRQPFTTACPGGDALPQGGGAAPNGCVAERQSEKLGACQLWKENHRGVKIIRAQHYAGVDTAGWVVVSLVVESAGPAIDPEPRSGPVMPPWCQNQEPEQELPVHLRVRATVLSAVVARRAQRPVPTAEQR